MEIDGAGQQRIIAVSGAKWGDEGKLKVLAHVVEHELGEGRRMFVARVGGGPNAGHSLVMDDGREFVTHQIDSGVFYPDVEHGIGPDTLLSPDRYIQEENLLNKAGIDTSRFRIDPRCALILDYNRKIDGIKGKALGTTGEGIGPTYADVRLRQALTAQLLASPEDFFAMLAPVLEEKRAQYERLTEGGDDEAFHLDYYRQRYPTWRDRIVGRLANVEELIHDHLAGGGDLVIEGAQGVLLDNKRGNYPYVTSTGTRPMDMLIAAGLTYPELHRARVILLGVQKAFDTRVGAGPFVSEMDPQRAAIFRDKTEHGSTTGRPRRIGDQDRFASRYVQRLAGYTHIAVTKVDALGGRGPVRFVDGYRQRSTGEVVKTFPTDTQTLFDCEPVYSDREYVLSSDITAVRRVERLPEEMQDYCYNTLRGYPGARLALIGVGRQTGQMIDTGALWEY